MHAKHCDECGNQYRVVETDVGHLHAECECGATAIKTAGRLPGEPA